jgi:hypothetical protein
MTQSGLSAAAPSESRLGEAVMDAEVANCSASKHGPVKQAGTNRVSIIGEPVGDRLMFFSDGLPIQLPHSGRFFLPAVARMDYRDGCREYDDCMEAIAQPGRPTAIVPLPTPAPLERLPISVATLHPSKVDYATRVSGAILND